MYPAIIFVMHVGAPLLRGSVCAPITAEIKPQAYRIYRTGTQRTINSLMYIK
jgi:hypothetical protein